MRLLFALSFALGALGAVGSHWVHDAAALLLAFGVVAQWRHIQAASC